MTVVLKDIQSAPPPSPTHTLLSSLLVTSTSLSLSVFVSQRDNGSNWMDLQALGVFLTDKESCVIPWC